MDKIYIITYEYGSFGNPCRSPVGYFDSLELAEYHKLTLDSKIIRRDWIDRDHYYEIHEFNIVDAESILTLEFLFALLTYE